MDRHGDLYSRELCRAVAAALDGADDGVWVTDRQGGLLFQNGTLRSMLAADAERRAVEETIADVRHAVVARSDILSIAAAETERQSGGASSMVGRPVASTTTLRPAVTVQVRTTALEYRVRGTIAHYAEAGRTESLVVVWVRKCRPRNLTLDALRDRFGLTPREVRVAALLGARSGSREIAEALGISRHTARRHAEAVLRKLGVHSRSEVAERLRA